MTGSLALRDENLECISRTKNIMKPPATQEVAKPGRRGNMYIIIGGRVVVIRGTYTLLVEAFELRGQ